MQAVYIQRLSSFLPGKPVANEGMEAILGQVGPRPSRARRIVLRNNGIHSRHYAIDPASGERTHNNADLTAAAVRGLIGDDFALDDLDLLACGTSSPDQLMPNHAVMVHGELGNPACEVTATAGICLAGMSALRYAMLAIAGGEADTAVATGSELASSFMRAGNFMPESRARIADLETQPELAFEQDFLRWMLSDGAGAMLLRGRPAARGLSLRIDWMVQRSFAHQLPVCMVAGGNKQTDGRLRGWREYPSPAAAADNSAFAVKQDVRLLNKHIVDVTFGQGLEQVRRRHTLRARDIDWFLPHYSSEYFRPRLAAAMAAADFAIPRERWFGNLREVGNVGSASIYLMLEALLQSDHVEPGQRLLCFVPESGRFSTAFMHLTAEAAG